MKNKFLGSVYPFIKHWIHRHPFWWQNFDVYCNSSFGLQCFCCRRAGMMTPSSEDSGVESWASPQSTDILLIHFATRRKCCGCQICTLGYFCFPHLDEPTLFSSLDKVLHLTLHCFIKFLLMIPTYWKCIIWLFLTCVSMYPLPLYNEYTHCLLSSCPFIIALLRTHSCLLSLAMIWFLTQYSSLQFLQF